MRIDVDINSFHIANELPAIDNLLENAMGAVSFWGMRVITVIGYRNLSH